MVSVSYAAKQSSIAKNAHRPHYVSNVFKDMWSIKTLLPASYVVISLRIALNARMHPLVMNAKREESS